MKQKLIAWTVNSPRQSIGLAMVLSLTLASGIFFLHIEDDIMKMLPEDVPSRIVWNEIEEQFGSTEPLIVSVGREGQSIFTPAGLAAVWDLTRTLEEHPAVDELRVFGSLAGQGKTAAVKHLREDIGQGYPATINSGTVGQAS